MNETSDGAAVKKPDGRGVDDFRRILTNQLTYSLSKDMYSATQRDKYTATALSVRARIVKNWIECQQSYYKHDAKRLYYLSLEFLMGRLLKNYLINIDLLDEYREAMDVLATRLEDTLEYEWDAGLGNGGLGNREDLAELVVELDRDVAGHLHVLLLVAPDRHHRGLVGEDVGGHQHGIVEERGAGGDALGQLVLVGVAALEQPHVCDDGEQPGQFRDFRHIALAEEDGLLRIKPAGQEVERHVARVGTQLLRVGDRGEGVVVGDEEIGLSARLQLYRGLHHPEIVADVQFAGGLDA